MNTLSARRSLLVGACVAALAVSSSVVRAQETPLGWAARLENTYRILPNVTYLTASNWEARLDLFVTRTPETPIARLCARRSSMARTTSASGDR